MRRKAFVAIVAAAFLAGTFSLADARWRGGGMNRGPGWNCPRGYDYQWNARGMGPGGGRMAPQMGPGGGRMGPQMGPGAGRMAPQMGPGGGRMGPQMGPGQMAPNPQTWQNIYSRNWEIRNQIEEKLQERAWLLQQDPVDRERVARLNEELAELQAEMWSIGPGAQGGSSPRGSGSWYCPAWQ